MGVQTSDAESEIRDSRVFVVEDDADIAGLVCFHLNSSGYTTKWLANSSSVIEEAEKERPSLFLLDIMIPGSDGIELCRHIRANKRLAGTRIIFLTAKTGEADRIKGFEIGGDDYITKPFSPRELVARVRAVLRRTVPSEQPDVLNMGEIEIDAALFRRPRVHVRPVRHIDEAEALWQRSRGSRGGRHRVEQRQSHRSADAA